MSIRPRRPGDRGRVPWEHLDGLPPTTPDTTAMPIIEALRTATKNEPWMDLANCLGVDPELFFPDRGMSTNEAKGVCRRCDVREECLEYALDHKEKFGIWGGKSERERRRIRSERRRGAGGESAVA